MTTDFQEIVFTKNDLPKVAAQLFELGDKVAVYTFTGPLGAGKTALISSMLTQAGVIEPIVSPTFTTINIYKNAQGQHFYHFDLYRMQTLEEFLAAGFQEYLYAPNSWALIEWPAVIAPLLTSRVCHILLDYLTENDRILRFHVVK